MADGDDNLKVWSQRLTSDIDRLIDSHDKLAEKETEHWESMQKSLGEIKITLATMKERNSTQRLVVTAVGAGLPGISALVWIIFKSQAG